MILPWRIQGPLHVEALEAAIGDLIVRHSALRTRLTFEGGQLVQIIDAAEPLPLAPMTVAGATSASRLEVAMAMLREEGRQSLDLGLKPPITPRLLRVAESDHILCFFVHHAICDGWSSQIMMRDLAEFYCARIENRRAHLVPLTQQYADFANWQIRTYESGGFANEMSYWREELANLPQPIELLSHISRKGHRDCRAESPFNIEAHDVLRGLKKLARRGGVSVFAVLLSAIAVLLHRITNADDLVVGVSTVNRWSKEAMQFVGCATNLLPARIRPIDSIRFDDLMREVNATVRRLLAYGQIPLELVLREVQGPLPGGPVFPIWCQYREPAPATVIDQLGLSFTPFWVDRAAILCDLEVDLIESERGLECVFAHRAALFEASSIAAMLASYGVILRSVLREPGLQISDLCDGGFASC